MMKRDDGKKKMKIKGPSKEWIEGIEQNNIPMPVGGSHVIPGKFATYLSFHCTKGLLKGYHGKNKREGSQKVGKYKIPGDLGSLKAKCMKRKKECLNDICMLWAERFITTSFCPTIFPSISSSNHEILSVINRPYHSI